MSRSACYHAEASICEQLERAVTIGAERGRARLGAVPALAPGAPTAVTSADTLTAALVRLPGVASVSAWAYQRDGTSQLLAVRPRRERAALEAAIHRLGGQVARDETVSVATRDDDAPVSILEVAVRAGGQAAGVVVLRLRAESARWTETRAAVLALAAPLVGALLGPALRTQGHRVATADRLRHVIGTKAFQPAFQPIVELEGGAIVGFEALTRFADGVPPDRVFAAATELGLSIELESAALEAVIDRATELPAEAWLNVNVSPDFVLAAPELRSILAHWNRRIVLELTEHTAVTDYPRLRQAVSGLGAHVRLAIDDAGAGFASFRHILELAPDLVKLDRSIVHAIGEDPGRQAFVAGMARFAALSGITLVAEGVETLREARALRRLEVPLAQGYYFGRPVPLADRAHGTPSDAADPAEPSRAAPSGSLELARVVTGAAPAAEIDRALNIGVTLAHALRAVGIETVGGLQNLGAVAAWDRLLAEQPALATETTLLRLEGAVRGARVSQLPLAERARLRGVARWRAVSNDAMGSERGKGSPRPH